MQPDLVVLLCDTARADAFRPWGGRHETPVVERLCREGIAFADAVAAAPWTVPSIASLFTGRLPTEHRITGACLTWEGRRPTSPAPCIERWAGPWLPEDLRRRGYRTWAASCNSWVTSWGGFDRGFDEMIDVRPWARPTSSPARLAFRARKAVGGTDRGGREAAERFQRVLADERPEPLFAFVDLMETHAPLDPPRGWYPFPPWRRVGTRRLTGGADQGLSYNAGLAEPAPGYVETVRALYYGSARYEDWLLGRFVDAVETRDRPTLVVVVGDHGEHLGEHGLFNHNSSLYEELLHVPLVVWGHRLSLGPARVVEPFSLPRLAEWLLHVSDGSTPEPPPADGSVVSEYEGTFRHNGFPGAVERAVRAGSAHPPALVLHAGVAVRDDRWKYVATDDGGEHLFDLEADPAEADDQVGRRADVSARFRPFRRAWEERSARLAASVEPGPAAEGEIAAHLRELGYIE